MQVEKEEKTRQGHQEKIKRIQDENQRIEQELKEVNDKDSPKLNSSQGNRLEPKPQSMKEQIRSEIETQHK